MISHSMLHISLMQQRKRVIFEIIGQYSSGSTVVYRFRRMPCVHSTMTDRRVVCTQDANQPTAVDACVLRHTTICLAHNRHYAHAYFVCLYH